jgi:tetratricopeptide (TPR) repeat protein
MKLLTGKISSLNSILFLSSVAVITSGIFMYSEHGIPAGNGTENQYTSSPDTLIRPKSQLIDTAYQNLIRRADQYLKANNPDACLEELQKALKIKPSDPALRNRITQVMGMISDRKKKQSEYQNSMASGDAAFQKKDYLNAKAYYQIALNSLPNDSVAINKLKTTMSLLRSQKAQNTLYDVAVANADRLLLAKEYDLAKEEYENASRILPAEAYPKMKINEIIKLKVDEQVREEQYSQAIKNGDQYYTSKNWQPALLEYQNAAKIKPEEKYPRDRITELTVLVAAQRSRDDAYIKSIAIADQQFEDKSYPGARKEYENASKIKPEQIYPKNKILEIDRLLADLNKLQKDFDHYVNLADSFYIDKNFIRARDYYVMALGAKPNERYPKEMLEKVKPLIAGQEAGEKAADGAYLSAITIADKEFADKNFDRAKQEYQRALGIKPAETYPKSKIQEIEKLLADQAKVKKLDENYLGAIAQGDSLLGARQYTLARVAFTEAAALKPSEIYPKEKLALINTALADQARQKQTDQQYMAAISAADKLFTGKSYAQAKVQYTSALNLKPGEVYPVNKIAEIDKLLEDIAKQKALDKDYADLLLSGEKLFKARSLEPAKADFQKALDLKPNEDLPKRRIASIDSIADALAKLKSLEEQYTGIISNADKLLSAKSWDQAKAEYRKALALKPSESYPKTKINEIDKILADIAAHKTLDSTYAACISSADKLLADKSYNPARAEYQKALQLKPDEAYPKSKITEIDNALAEISRIKSIDEKYQLSISKADQLLASKSYTDARQEYTIASGLKPAETYPGQKIAEIDKALAEIAKQKALDEEYNGIITDAEKLYASRALEPAKADFQKALDLKPNEVLPKRRIASIDSITDALAKLKSLEEQYTSIISNADKLMSEKSYVPAKTEYQKASALKPAESYPKTKINEIDKILADIAARKTLDSTYSACISSGDKLMADKSYDQARTEYQKALQLKADESYPKSKMTEIENALAEIARLKAIDEKYQAALQKADQALLAGNYAAARAAYLEAGKIKPGEAYPSEKIKEVDGKVAEIARQKSIDDKYKAAVAHADQLFSAKSYDQARVEYNNALVIKPGEQYPNDKIREIESILAEIKAKEDAYKASVLKADQLLADKKFDEARTEYGNALTIKPNEQYPKNKIDEINKKLIEQQGRKKTFDDLVLKGDNSYGDKDWVKAKDYFQQASGLFPEEKYPKDRLERINSVIDSLYRANKGRYDKAIAEADKFYNGFEFDKAIDSYTEAAGYLPMENYPKEMIAKIRRTLAENAIADVLNSPVTITSNDEKQFKFTPVNIASRKENFIYVKLRNLSGKPFNVLLRYGKDKQPSGGIVIRNLSTDGKVNERLISVREQDVWYRIDNDFISLYPQGGDIEVSFIQVSKAR